MGLIDRSEIGWILISEKEEGSKWEGRIIIGGPRVWENSAIEDECTISTHQTFDQDKDKKKRGCSIFAYKEHLLGIWTQVSTL